MSLAVYADESLTIVGLISPRGWQFHMPDNLSSKSSVLSKLVENTPLVIILIGLIFIVIGANGGWTKADLKIDSTSWRVALTAMGLIVFAVGGLFLWREKNPASFANKADSNIEDDPKKRYGIKILIPEEGA